MRLLVGFGNCDTKSLGHTFRLRRRIRFKYIYIYQFIVNSHQRILCMWWWTEVIVKGTKIKIH